MSPGCHLAVTLTLQGSCECKPYVEGVACDRCKPLYWNLSPDTPYGCASEGRTTMHLTPEWMDHIALYVIPLCVCVCLSGCECNTAGTVSGVAECKQVSGLVL